MTTLTPPLRTRSNPGPHFMYSAAMSLCRTGTIGWGERRHMLPRASRHGRERGKTSNPYVLYEGRISAESWTCLMCAAASLCLCPQNNSHPYQPFCLVNVHILLESVQLYQPPSLKGWNIPDHAPLRKHLSESLCQSG